MTTFSTAFQKDLTQLMKWRRDVRHFKTDPVDEALLQECLDAFLMAPSVGLSEPWRLIRIESHAARTAALENFKAENDKALTGYRGEKAALYASLKLSGMAEAPVQFAIYCDDGTTKGDGLGAGTMPETRKYSVVSAINLFWLAARARGLGVGWVSVLDPERLGRDLDVEGDWTFVAYLCVGYPKTSSDHPELEQLGWEDRRNALPILTR
ncbi:5,6-dimethylbenzimidazole synthase [uncultured Shimia sp.]|uniref:5,6-dimethylbenzimidazole synthase n=1 Tax=uncultured Shimia sp. TaxID=573152 RepID=UPI00263108F4|nr:5,6-dimethylbenzimidazole synthase [uncultured Shimia sp.]